jgi:hypothetical protein
MTAVGRHETTRLRSLVALDDLLREQHAPSDQAERIADWLLTVAPEGGAACWLTAVEPPVLARRNVPDDVAAAIGQRLDGPGRGAAVALKIDDRVLGFLYITKDDPATTAHLEAAARLVSLHVDRVASALRDRGLRRRAERDAASVLLAESALMLTHDLNNHLNSIILQTAVVQMKVDADRRKDLDVVRDQGRQAANLIRLLEGAWQQRRQASAPVDPTALIREAVLEEDLGDRVRIEAQPEPLAFTTNREPLGLLVRCLLRKLARESGPPSAPIQIMVSRHDSRTDIRLATADPATSSEVAAPFNPDEGPFAGASLLEGLAVQSLLRQCGAQIKVRCSPSGSLIFDLIFD